MVYDADKENAVMVGGTNNAGDSSLNDVWHYQSATGWTEANPPPVPVAYHRMVYDTARQLMLLFVNGETWQYK